MSVIDAIIAKKLCGGGGSVPKPLTYDYMPEGYPKKSVQTTTLMEEQELAFVLNKDAYRTNITNPFEIIEGQTYTVNWDGTEYECVGFVFSSVPMIGNLSIGGAGDNTGEPFLYTYNIIDQPIGQFITTSTSSSHAISVTTTEKIVTPMTTEFLPAAALITYDSNTSTYISDFTNDELYERLLGGKQVVLHDTVNNEYLYLTNWTKATSGRIDLAFAGKSYSVSLLTDGTIGKTPQS